MNKEFKRMQKLAGIITEGYQGTDYGSSEDMALDMVKTEAGLPGGLPEGKMTAKEFKKKIKEAILAERALKEDTDVDVDNVDDQAASEMGSLDEYDTQGLTNAASIVDHYLMKAYDLGASGQDFDDNLCYSLLDQLEGASGDLTEAKKKKEEEEPEMDTDVSDDVDNLDLNLDDTEAGDDTKVDMNMDTTSDVDAGSSESKKAFSELTDAYRAAKELGDEKLIRQIANTITYFNKNIILNQG